MWMTAAIRWTASDNITGTVIWGNRWQNGATLVALIKMSDVGPGSVTPHRSPRGDRLSIDACCELLGDHERPEPAERVTFTLRTAAAGPTRDADTSVSTVDVARS